MRADNWKSLPLQKLTKYVDNLIIVDGNYRYIPTRMRPAEHEEGVSYDAGAADYNWTPTDGKGLK